MRHRVAGRHLGRDTAHRTAMYRNLITDLLRYERITTTEAKAKEIRPMAEKIITLGKRGDLHARRQASRVLYDPKVVKKVFDEIGPRMSERPGGYLRITALEERKGDGAKMAAIELVDLNGVVSMPRPQRVTAAPAARAATRPAVEAAPVAAIPEAEVAEESTLAAEDLAGAVAEAPAEAVAEVTEAVAEAEPVTVEAEAAEPAAETSPAEEGEAKA
jgi:large subunit ribosomal protein L17